MNDKQIACFIWAATYQNFRQAAERLFMSQPAITYQIRSLEEELGFSLFERDGKRVTLTAAGAVLQDELPRIGTRLNQAIARAREAAHDSDHKRLLVGWPPPICERQTILDLIAAHGSRYGEVECEIVILDRVERFGVSGSRELDVAATLVEDTLSTPGFEHVPLFEVRRACVVGTGHPLASSRLVTWDMLQSQEILVLAANSYLATYGHFSGELRANVPARAIHYCDSNAEIEVNVTAGRGVTVRPVRPSSLLAPTGGLVAIPIEPCVTSHLGLAYRREGKREARDFCLFAGEYFEGHARQVGPAVSTTRA